ncbi:MAG: PTS sugar transporter subunit IIB [Bacilli bacterium]|uniref:PTS system mannose/fructose/N-acetylgalactosamine-transporter subunit IIB n=1 Tax=Anaerorhabdus sp. TaxID=1872524 RepID=UPI002FCA0615
MIKLFRLDERLIHGQIAIKWSRHTGVGHIVVANDAASKSEFIQKTLKMAAPAGIKTAVKSVDDAIKLLNDSRCEAMKILVLVNNPKDALTMVNNVKGIPFVNVGNYGRVAPEKPGMPRKSYGNNIYCDVEEVEDFRALVKTGLKCIYQTTPEEPAEDLNKIFK